MDVRSIVKKNGLEFLFSGEYVILLLLYLSNLTEGSIIPFSMFTMPYEAGSVQRGLEQLPGFIIMIPSFSFISAMCVILQVFAMQCTELITYSTQLH